MTPHSVLFFCQNLHPSSEQSGSNSISFGAARSSSAHVICMSAVFGQQCCVRLHGPKSLTDFKLYATSANIHTNIHHFSGAPRRAFQQPVYNKYKVRWLRVLARPLQAVHNVFLSETLSCALS